MDKSLTIEPEKIHITQIKTIKGNIDTSTELLDVEIERYKFNFDVALGSNSQEKVVSIQLVADIEAMTANDEPIGVKGSFTHEIFFIVDNLDSFIKTEDGNVFIESRLGSTLISIAYSTIRGIIYTRTQGTSLNGVLLPVIDPKKIMESKEGA